MYDKTIIIETYRLRGDLTVPVITFDHFKQKKN
jgi:hypothetical protein